MIKMSTVLILLSSGILGMAGWHRELGLDLTAGNVKAVAAVGVLVFLLGCGLWVFEGRKWR